MILCIIFVFHHFTRNFVDEIQLMLFETCSNLKKLKGNPNFHHGSQWFGHFLKRYVNWDYYPSIQADLAISARFIEKWQWFHVTMSVNLFSKNPPMAFVSFSFRIICKPNGLSKSFEILQEQMVGYMLFGKSNLNFQKYK